MRAGIPRSVAAAATTHDRRYRGIGTAVRRRVPTQRRVTTGKQMGRYAGVTAYDSGVTSIIPESDRSRVYCDLVDRRDR